MRSGWRLGIVLVLLKLIFSLTTAAHAQQPLRDTDFILKAVDRSLVNVGDTITYTVTFVNPKSVPLHQVVITDYFDSRLDNLRIVSNTVGVTVLSGNTMTAKNFDLLPGQSFSLVIQGTVSDRALPGNVITSAATLESPDASIHLSNRVETAVLPSALPETGELSRAAWFIWKALPLVLLISVGGWGMVSWRTYRRLHQRS